MVVVAGFAACHTVLVEGKWVNYREQPPLLLLLLLPQSGITIGGLFAITTTTTTALNGKERKGGTNFCQAQAQEAQQQQTELRLKRATAHWANSVRAQENKGISLLMKSLSFSVCVCVFARVPLHGCPSPSSPRSLGQSVSQTPQSPQSKPSSHLWAPSK